MAQDFANILSRTKPLSHHEILDHWEVLQEELEGLAFFAVSYI